MMNLLIKNKVIFYPFVIIFSPLFLIYIFAYGSIIGFVGGIVWGMERGLRFINSGAAKRAVAPNKLRLFHKIMIMYIYLHISIFSGLVCIFVGQNRAYKKLKTWLSGGVIFKKKKIGNRPLVMVVDDEVELADNFAERIRSNGVYETIVAHNGLEALQYVDLYERFLGIAENRIGCIVLDIKMPEMDGLTFLKELRKKEGAMMFSGSGSFHRLPVIILSAYEDVEKITDATHPKLGQAVRYIVKPARINDLDELVSTIDSVFANKEQDMIISTYLSANFRINELQKNEP